MFVMEKGSVKKGNPWGKKVLKVLPAVAAFSLASGTALAGTDTTFDNITATINDWATGSLGKTLTIGTLLVGGGMAVVSQSLKTALSAVGLALALAYGPGVIQGLFTALF